MKRHGDRRNKWWLRRGSVLPSNMLITAEENKESRHTGHWRLWNRKVCQFHVGLFDHATQSGTPQFCQVWQIVSMWSSIWTGFKCCYTPSSLPTSPFGCFLVIWWLIFLLHHCIQIPMLSMLNPYVLWRVYPHISWLKSLLLLVESIFFLLRTLSKSIWKAPDL